MTGPLKAIQNTIEAQQKIYQAAYGAGLRAGMAKLDQAWAEIEAAIPNTSAGASPEQNYGQRFMAMRALGIIGRLGGMDPQRRGRG